MITGIVRWMQIGLILTLLPFMVTQADAGADQKKTEEAGGKKQSIQTDAHGIKLNEIVVIAKETQRAYSEPYYSRLSLSESSTAETVYTAKDIESIQPETIFDLIDLTPNVVQTYGNPMTPNGMKSRGGDRIGLIIDGIYIPSTQSGRMLMNFPVTIIDSMRVVRDSTALTLGPLSTISSSTSSPNAAVEGYIVITTKKPDKKAGAFRLSYDTHQTMQASASYGDVKDKWYYSFSFNHKNTPEWDHHNDADRSDSFHLRGGYTGDSVLTNISIYADFAEWECDRMDNNGVLGEAMWEYDPSDTLMLSADITKLWGPNNTTTFSFGYSQVTSTLIEDYSDRDASILYHGKYAPMEWDLDEHVTDLNLGHTFTMGRNTLKVGGQAMYWDMRDMQGFTYRDKEEEGFGVYFTDEYRVTQKFTIDAGGRLDTRHTIKQNDPKFNDTWAENTTSYALGAAYQLNPILKLTSRFSYSEQPAYDFLLKINENKSFDSDTRYKYEVGLRADYSLTFNIDCTLFYYDINNYKYAAKSQSNPATGETDYYYDSADLAQKGFEIGIRGELLDNLTYNATYSYLDIDDDSVSKTLPQDSANLMFNYMYGDYTFNVTGKYLGEYSQTATTGEGLGDYIVVDANISRRLTEKSKITLYAKNITNEKYAEAYKNSAMCGMLGYIYNRGAGLGLMYSMEF